jgi:5'-nucleotidase
LDYHNGFGNCLFFLITAGNPPSDDTCKGPYPYIVHPDHNMSLSVPVVQAYYYTKYLGKLQVTFNDLGEVTGWSGNPVLLNSAVAKDQHVYGIVKKMKKLVDDRGNVCKLIKFHCAPMPGPQLCYFTLSVDYDIVYVM